MWKEVLLGYRFVFLFFYCSSLVYCCLSHLILTFISPLQSRFDIVARPCKLHSSDSMEVIITACIILHNMIIVDEWDDETLDQKYLKDRDSAFVVDKVTRGKPEDSQLISNHIRTVRKEYMSYTEHMRLKSDLVEHLWDLKGTRSNHFRSNWWYDSDSD